jgi:flagellar motility protein MotE (MotC chaperone)
MTKSVKTVKIFALGLVTVAILAGAGFFLARLGIIAIPPALQGLFLMRQPAAPASGGELLQLQQNLSDKENQISELEASLSAAETALRQSQDSQAQLKAEVARLNQEVLNLQSGVSGKEAAYKDMAPYFANMKAKDAADILSRLKDDDIIGILSAMEKDTAAGILPLMNHDQAAALTVKMLVTPP